MNMRSPHHCALPQPPQAFADCRAAQAQTVLKFHHTDNPAGSRDQAAGGLLRKRVTEYTEGATRCGFSRQVSWAMTQKGGKIGPEKPPNALGGVDFTACPSTGSYASHLPSLNLDGDGRFWSTAYEQRLGIFLRQL